MKIDTERRPPALGVNGETEVKAPRNTFVEFIQSCSETFDEFNSAYGDQRVLERVTKARFNEEFGKLEATYRTSFKISKGKIAHLRSVMEGIIFRADLGKYDPDATGGLQDAQRDRLRRLKQHGLDEEMNTPIKVLTQEYEEEIVPIERRMFTSGETIRTSLQGRLSENYQTLVDMLDFFGNPRHAALRAEVMPYFRAFHEVDTKARRSGKKSLWEPVRSSWEERSKWEFDDVLFERFWSKIIANPSANAQLLGTARFASIARQGGFIEPFEEPTIDEVKQLFWSVPLKYWPPDARAAYASISKTDTSYLIENIRAKLADLYKLPESSIALVDFKEDAEGARKRVKVEQVDEAEAETVFEAGERVKDHRLGLIKAMIGASHNTHYSSLVEDRDRDQVVSNLASSGKSKRMRDDLKQALTLLIQTPVGPGREKLEDSRFVIDGKTLPAWRLDIGGLRGQVQFKDNQTWRWRIVYALSDDQVLIRGVYNHDDYLAASKRSFR